MNTGGANHDGEIPCAPARAVVEEKRADWSVPFTPKSKEVPQKKPKTMREKRVFMLRRIERAAVLSRGAHVASSMQSFRHERERRDRRVLDSLTM